MSFKIVSFFAASKISRLFKNIPRRYSTKKKLIFLFFGDNSLTLNSTNDHVSMLAMLTVCFMNIFFCSSLLYYFDSFQVLLFLMNNIFFRRRWERNLRSSGDRLDCRIVNSVCNKILYIFLCHRLTFVLVCIMNKSYVDVGGNVRDVRL